MDKKQEKKVIDFDNFKGHSKLKPVGRCNLAIPEEKMERRIQEEMETEKKQNVARSDSKWEKILRAEPREAREAVLKAMEEDEVQDED